MARSLWLVATRCTDPAREAGFNSWYDQFHLPDMLAVPHVVAAQRYTLAAAPSGAADSAPQYLAVYELDTEEPEAVMRSVSNEHAPRWRAANRMVDCIETVSSYSVTPLGARRQAAVTAAGS